MALTPRNYGQTCTMKMLKAGVAGSNWADNTAEAIKEGFEDSVDYRIVYRNMDYGKFYKTWIYEGNASEKTVGYLHLLSYPYDSVQFKIGDYIQFDYYHDNVMPPEYKFWILQSLDCRLLYNVHGRILPCNQLLRWQDSTTKEIFSYPCYFNTEMTKTNILDSSQGFNVESGALIAIVQLNENTNTIYVNQRFMLGGRTYVCYQFNNNIDKGLLYVYLRLTAELPEDDFTNSLAYNGEELIVDNGITLTGDVINLEDSQSLRQGDSLHISIYNYVNGIKSADIYEVHGYDVPIYCYELSSLDNNGVTGNEFVLTNLEHYSKAPLQLKFINLSSEEEKICYVWLGGAL